MRRIRGIILVFALLFALALPAGADTEVTSMRYQATIAGDGSAQITVTVNLHLETAQEDLTFPVPISADNISINGEEADIQERGEAAHIDLSDILGSVAGSFSFVVNYKLPDVLSTNEAGLPMLELPMLSGFAYPVAYMEFSVSLPADVEAKPAFSSGYHQSSIEKELYADVSGNLVSGRSLKDLKDHETLVMKLDVREEMFPDTPVNLDTTMLDILVAGGCLLLAFLYWLLFLRTTPLRATKSVNPPEGFSAGEIGGILALQGCDLSLTVFTWGQLGYVLIQPDRNGRVLLHKRMKMGNERSEFEQHLFRSLFRKRPVVDATSQRYADLCLKAQKLSSNVRALLMRNSGNPSLFRILGAVAAAVCGFFVGVEFADSGFLHWFFGICMGALGYWSAGQIQKWAPALLLLHKRPIWNAALWSLVWIAAGLLADTLVHALMLVLSQLLVGLMATYGGRRTELGRQTAGQILGLRRYLKNISYQDVWRMMETDPEFFHNLAPYALALGVDRAFAKGFGHEGISGCPYLTTGMDGHRSAMEWCEFMRTTKLQMDRRNNQRKAELFRKILTDLKK